MSNAADLTASSISGQVFPLRTRSLMVFLVTLAITATTISFASFDVRGGNEEEKGGRDGTEATALYLSLLISDSEKSTSLVVFGLTTTGVVTSAFS